MKYKKRPLAQLFFFVILFAGPLYVYAEDDDFSFDFFDDGDDDYAASMYTQNAIPLTRLPKSQTLSTLTSLDIQDVIQTELYLHTHAPLSRSPLDLPVLQIMTLYTDQFRVIPFFSSIWEESYTTQSTHIDSYIDLKLNDVMDVLDTQEFTTIQVPDVLELFRPLKMQEHTFGFMFQGLKTINGWTYTFGIPLEYVINNFYLTSEEKERINNFPLFVEFNGDVFDFARKHLIADRIGIGDTQVTAEYWIEDSYKMFQSIGITLNIPTAFAFKKGLLGTNFKRDAKPYPINLYTDLIDPYLEDLLNGTNQYTEFIQQNAENFSLSALDRLSTMLLDRHMGEDYHVGIGLCYRCNTNFNDTFSYISKTNAEVQLPSVLQRFFLVQPQSGTFMQYDWADNDAQVNEKLNLLNTQLNYMFFPVMYYATVFPGCLLHTTSYLKYYIGRGRWSPCLGFDTWFHSGEHFLDVNTTTGKPLRGFEVNIEKGRRKRAWSSSLLFALEKEQTPESDWTCAARAYVSVLNVGFGDAFGLSFIIEKLF